MNSLSTLLLGRSAANFLFSLFVSVAKPESLRKTVGHIIIGIILLQPTLVHATPLVRSGEHTVQHGLAMFHSLIPIVIKGGKHLADKLISIDEGIMKRGDKTQVPSSTATAAFNHRSTVNAAGVKFKLTPILASSALLTTTLNFSTAPTLLSGTALTQGAVYRFPNVTTGIDAKVTLTTIATNTVLTNIDDNTTNPGRFQPVIRHNAAVKSADSYVRFDFQLVIAGTNTSASASNIYLSFQDIDGDGGTNTIREFVEVVGSLTTYLPNPTTLRSALPILGGLNFEQSNSTNSQAGIGTGDNFEVYGYLGSSVSSFTIIGGNHNGATGCSGAGCDRQNSWSFDQADVQKLDFSDAPASYSDVYHPIPLLPTVYFGNGVTGDDAPNYSNTDTDDGIASLPSLSQSATSYSVTLACKGTSVPVSAWADFNKNTTFDSGEKTTGTCNGVSVTLNWTGLSGLVAGSSYARFRIASTATDIAAAVGTASNGEVEDYPFTITAPNVVGYKSVKLTSDGDASGTITPGDTLTYTLQYVNTGNGGATNFQITDLLPAGISITATGTQSVTVSGSGTTAAANTAYTGGVGAAVSNLLASGATLAVGGVVTVTIPVRVNTGFSGSVTNQASGTGTGLSSPVFTDNAGVTADLPTVVTSAPYNLTIPAGSVAQTITGTVDTTTFIVSGLPDLKLTKSAPAAVQAGGSMTYTMTVSNVGNGVTFGTTAVKDTLPTGVTVNSGAAGSVVLAGAQAANWTCNSDALAPQSITCTSTTAIVATSGTSVFAFNVNAAATLTANAINQAKVFGGGDPNKAVVTSTGLITACTSASENTAGSAANAGCAYESTPVINVEAYKSVKLITDADASGSITPGDTLNYTIHYINLGALVANFQINDQLPAGITLAATGGQTVLAAGSGTSGGKNPAYTGAASGALSNLIAAGANLNTDGAFTVTIPVTINAGFTGTIANQATGFGDLIPPAGIKTDNAGQTSDMSARVTAAPYNMSIPAGSIPQTIAGTVDPTTFAVAAVIPPSLTLRKSVSPTGNQPPGTELTYSITFTNTGGSLAREVVLTDAVPIATDFKVGSVTTDPGSTGLTIVVEYSNDYVSATPTAATWTYTPVSGGGGAPTNFDRDVKALRWRVTAGNLSSITPDNSGEVGFIVIIR